MSDPTMPISAGTAEPPRHNYVKWVTAFFLGLVLIVSVVFTIVSVLQVDSVKSGEQDAIHQAVITALTQQARVFDSTLSKTNTELAQLKAKNNAPRQAQELALIGKLGFCVSEITDQATFDVSSIIITSPVVSNGVYSCNSGQFVSVVATHQ